MSKIWGRFFIAMILVMLAMPSARAETRFFNELGDVPIMPAMAELPERAVVFDAPTGKIAQVTALPGAGTSMAAVEGFYAEILPQFGWQKAAGGAYVREDQRLILSAQNEGGRTLAIFRLEPR